MFDNIIRSLNLKEENIESITIQITILLLLSLVVLSIQNVVPLPRKSISTERAALITLSSSRRIQASSTTREDISVPSADRELAGYNLLVTSKTDKTPAEIYQNLWRIKESFRIIKSDLNVISTFFKTENKI